MRLHQAMIYAKDFDAMTEFYGKVLGLRVKEKTRSVGWVEFEEGVAIHAIPAEIAVGIEIASPPEPREETPMKLIFQTEDMEAVVERLRAHGIACNSTPWGAVDFVDPEGNVMTLVA